MTRLLDHHGDPLPGPDCDVCMGSGVMKMDGQEYRCRSCGGSGRVVKTTEVTTLPPIEHTPTDPLALIAAAVTAGADPDQLAKLVDLQERIDRRNAEKAYNAAMAACQAEMPPITRTKKNAQTNSMYAPFEELNETIRPIYTKHGFSLGFTEVLDQPKEGTDMHIACDVRHREGHTVRHQGIYPRDDVGIKGSVNKTPIWGVGSSHSYAKRYLCKDIFNLSEANEDNDGQLIDTLIAAERDEIEELLIRTASDKPAFLRWLGYESVEKIRRADFSKATWELKRKAAKKGGNGA